MAEFPKGHPSSLSRNTANPLQKAGNKQKAIQTKQKDTQEKPANRDTVLRAVEADSVKQTVNNKKSSAKNNNQILPPVAWGTALESIFSTVAKETEQCQGTFFAIGCEGMENIRNFAESAFRGFDETFAFQKDNLESAFATCNATYQAAQSLQQLFSKAFERQLPNNANVFQDFLECKTANDWFSLQSRLIKNNLDASLGVFSEVTQTFLDFSDEVLEPLGERVVNFSKQVSSRFSGAA